MLKAAPIPTLKGKGYQVILPKNMDMPILSDAERAKIIEKEYQIKNEGKTELGKVLTIIIITYYTNTNTTTIKIY
jgi:hypothetical protein